jgi:hypothetical protein
VSAFVTFPWSGDAGAFGERGEVPELGLRDDKEPRDVMREPARYRDRRAIWPPARMLLVIGLNWPDLTWMHPSDTRMASYGPVTFLRTDWLDRRSAGVPGDDIRIARRGPVAR